MHVEPTLHTIARVGKPTVGKSTPFNALTGARQHVGSRPGKTVEGKEGIACLRNHEIAVVDLPGTCGLNGYSIGMCSEGWKKGHLIWCRIARMEEIMTSPPSDTITPEEWQQTPASVQNWIGELMAEVKQLRETVVQLQEIVNRNSQNSSQPPSQDRPEQKPANEPSGPPRKRGG
jgi:GTPase involved in cell partitioning and DNA repair